MSLLFQPAARLLNPPVSAAGPVCTITMPGQSGVTFSLASWHINIPREQMFELGRRGPYYRYLNYPVQLTAELRCGSGTLPIW